MSQVMRLVAALAKRAFRAEAENKRLRDALKFYADPETYFGVSFLADRPTGGFDEDVDLIMTDDGRSRTRPGKLARDTLVPGWDIWECGSGDFVVRVEDTEE